MEVYINGLGTVTAFKTVTIRSRVEGELVKVAFTEGQMVKEGDLLAEIDRRPFEKTLEQYEGQLERDEATLKLSQLTLKRYEELLLKGSIEAQKVDEQRGLVKQTNGAILTDRALVGNARLQLDFCRIVAPIGGRIGLRLVDQGNIVRANDITGLAVITQLQPISLVFPIPQDDISRVQKAWLGGSELVVYAYDRNLQTKLATGKLASIDNQVDLTTGTVRLKAVFENEDGILFPNQFVNARLLVDIQKDVIVVPSAAVQRGPSFTFVYVVQPDETPDVQKVDLRTVKTGLVEGAETAIVSGLEPGEIVVTEGLDKLTKESKVTVGTKDKEKEKKAGSAEKSGSAEKTVKDKTETPAKDKSESSSSAGKKGPQ
jgi:multidrug efflux system membrane fusion protein